MPYPDEPDHDDRDRDDRGADKRRRPTRPARPAWDAAMSWVDDLEREAVTPASATTEADEA